MLFSSLSSSLFLPLILLSSQSGDPQEQHADRAAVDSKAHEEEPKGLEVGIGISELTKIYNKRV